MEYPVDTRLFFENPAKFMILRVKVKELCNKVCSSQNSHNQTLNGNQLTLTKTVPVIKCSHSGE